ncbi:hypothetical protein HK096_006723 [Nowakowskiella sp. JEL0078]|nr:hypothetical protein HK096_006723 [Nowakowskiella sp. JEL0078]
MPSAVPAILVGVFASFGGFLFGYDTGTISGVIAMPAWLIQFGSINTDPTTMAVSPYAISSSIEALVVSILSLGEFSGALLGAYLADAYGRRLGLIVSCLVFCVGVAFQTAAWELAMFVVGRIVAGLGVGLISAIVPMYQSECSPKWIRGAVVSCYQWTITIGLLIASVVNNATSKIENASAYRIPIGIQIAFGVFLGAGMIFMPESPRWYIKKGDKERAIKSLAYLNGTDINDEIVINEYQTIYDNFEHEKTLGNVSYADCFKQGKSKMLYRTMMGIWLQAFQQLTGVNFIFYYGTTFFQRSGISNAFLISVITNVVNVVSTLPGIWGVEKIGRRRLLLIGAAGMCICEFIVAIVAAAVGASNASAQIVLIVFVCIYIFFFASTWGPIAWVIVGEIYPLNVRSKAMSMATASNWFWNFIIGLITPFMVNSGAGNANLGSNVFFIWGTTCAMCFVFVYFFVPETKGLSLEQIDELIENTTPRESTKYIKNLKENSGADVERILKD